jgi:hypothetical protein
MRRLRHDTSGRVLAGLIVTVSLLVPLAVFGAPALARTGASASEYQYSSSAQYQYRIQVCHLTHSKKHRWHTIRISVRAWRAHKRHGDQLGACAPIVQLPKHLGHGRRHGKGHGVKHDRGASFAHGQGASSDTGASSQTQTTSTGSDFKGHEHGGGGDNGRHGHQGKDH